MDRSTLIANGIIMLSDLVLLAAVIYGVRVFLMRKAPLYFRILTLATVCYASASVFRMLYYLCYQVIFQGMGITFFGYFGCYLFLFSANFGQYDSLIDEKSTRFRKYRIISVLAPAAVLVLILIHTFSNAENAAPSVNFVTGIGYIPAVFASYYNLKHFIIPDMGFLFVRWIRRANLCALIIEVADVLRVLLSALADKWPGALLSLIISAAFLMMLLFAEGGRKTWLR
ncbi:MAG: hypothetical protein Q3985_05560 [Eubacteriales bacterium]|nr:hypothetical protein [Eubacteriales bacterium]